MNQILSVEMNNDNRKNKGPKGPIELKKIIIFFCIALILFGVVMAVKGIISSNSEKDGSSQSGNGPSITTSKESNKLIVTITHNRAIDKLTYNWNGGENKEISGNGYNYMEESIEIPAGNSVLNIIVSDVNGKQTTYTKEFSADPTEPQISLELVGTKIKIIAKDNEKLSMITYRWDSEPEQQIEIPEDSSAQVEKEIEILGGQHTLTVVAVNSKNKQVTKTQEVKGVKKPTLSAIKDPEDPSKVILTAIDENSLMKEIEIYINGKGYVYRVTQDDGTKIEYKFPVQPGLNEIKLVGRNMDNIEETITVYYTYNVEDTENQ